MQCLSHGVLQYSSRSICVVSKEFDLDTLCLRFWSCFRFILWFIGHVWPFSRVSLDLLRSTTLFLLYFGPTTISSGLEHASGMHPLIILTLAWAEIKVNSLSILIQGSYFWHESCYFNLCSLCSHKMSLFLPKSLTTIIIDIYINNFLKIIWYLIRFSRYI